MRLNDIAILLILMLVGGASVDSPRLLRESVSIPPRQQTLSLSFSTYFESIRDVALDNDGNVVGAGECPQNGGLPATTTFVNSGTPEPGSAIRVDVCVGKVSRTGQLLWLTRIGGPNHDRAYAVEVRADNSIIVAGRAGAGYPTTAGAVQRVFQGGQSATEYGQQDGFVSALSANGRTMLWSTYFGTSDPQIIRDVAVDPAGDVYIAAGFSSSGYPAPIPAAFLNSPQGAQDVVIAKLSADGSGIRWARYVGGTANENGEPSVRTDAVGIPYLLVTTDSSGIATPGAYDTTNGGGGDYLVCKLTPAGSITWCSYLGGSANESTETHEFAGIDAEGNVYVTGPTQSSNFPTTAGAWDTTYNGGNNDIFISKFSPDGGRLLASTLFGGSVNDRTEGAAVTPDGRVFITGVTGSPNFPIAGGAFQPQLRSPPNSTSDAFLAVLSPNLNQLLYSSYLGGSQQDNGRGLAVDRSSIVAVGGETESSNDFPTINGIGGSSRVGFLARFDATDAPPPPNAVPDRSAPGVTAVACVYKLTASPPDGTGGWTAYFRRDDGLRVGLPDRQPPFERMVEHRLNESHSYYVVWTKSGGPSLTSAATTCTCGG